jgi:predicted permease
MSRWKKEIRARLAGLELEPAREAAIVEELSQDLDEFYSEQIAGGASSSLAARRTLAELSEHHLLAQGLRRVERQVVSKPIVPGTTRRSHMIADLWQDLRYGARTLLKNPVFTVITVATLALGIGANAAIFSVVNGVLLKPLPYPEPDQLMTLHQSKQNFPTGSIPYPNFLDWERENKTFSAIAISRGLSLTLTGAGEPEQIRGQAISAEFFSIIGVGPMLGRTFTKDDDRRGASPVAVISEGLWRRVYDASPAALGKSITVANQSYTIIGVMPSSFKLAVSNFRPRDVYLPIGQWGHPALQNRSAAFALKGIGRLKPGVSVAQAQADLDRVMQGLALAYPEANKENGARVIPFKDLMVRDSRQTLLILLGAVVFVLLIACVNVSNLLLARSTGRTREFAIRAALGAGQWRLVRQMLTESVLLALLGGGLGLILAQWGLKAALASMPSALPRVEEISVDPKVLLFTLAVSLLTGVLAGLAPALKPSRLRLSETLKTSGQGASVARLRTQGLFVAVEMALALVLLIGAGLLIRSLYAAWRVDPGFRPEKVLTFNLGFPESMLSADLEGTRAAMREIEEQIRSAPGVQASSFSFSAIPMVSEDDRYFWLESWPKPSSPAEMRMALTYVVDPGYLPAMGLSLKQGRFFTPQDDHTTTPVAVIDEAFARQYFKDESPIGKRVFMSNDEPPSEIVGVVGHVNQWGLDNEASVTLQAQLYTPVKQIPFRAPFRGLSGFDVVVRSEGSESSAFESIRRTLLAKNSQLRMFRPQTMSEVLSNSLAERKFAMILLQGFALTALLLASIGLYGVISYLVGQQTREIGVRLALGAQAGDVLRLVLGHGMKMALLGMALGLVAAFGLTRLISTMLFGVGATDPMTFTGVTLLLIIVALLACYLPARRATKVDPLTALRSE